ncbi:hypothetical protein [Gordonia sp. NB41Y]|uniref:hypothetical protein n=1 Tax=Gordonia sp. NB41Y TaxID=875808 RepID=UPI0002BE2063|nr:hypothetical protein [Gordonia sp. NB41Y]EMP10035.1 hypothetical protein ISGA_1813 [Gordonia sp. NB41Y]WLP90254.1 hypothetical protein Q9K23_22515 [Gordonia sp. NB41Y]
MQRKTGDGAYGPIHATEVELFGRIKHVNKLVIDDRGNEVVSSTQVSMSAVTERIPVGSLARVDGDDDWRPVITESPHIGGFDRSPDYYSISLA